jgi:hypothetical protein
MRPACSAPADSRLTKKIITEKKKKKKKTEQNKRSTI